MLTQRRLLSRTSQILLDSGIFTLAFALAFLIRFEGRPPSDFGRQALVLFPGFLFLRILSFYLFSIYSLIWRYFSISEAFLVVKALVPASVIFLAGRLVVPAQMAILKLPLSVIFLELVFSLTGTIGLRVMRRLHYETKTREKNGLGAGNRPRRRTLLVGAGEAGHRMMREIQRRYDLGIDVVGFIDDDQHKQGALIQGLSVLGPASRIPDVARALKVDDVVITIANAASADIRRIVGLCEKAGVRVRIIPALNEILMGKERVTKIREIRIEDLLGRAAVDFNKHREEKSLCYQGKRILVTGAGGSIGSELCRQLAGLWPELLIVLDKDENGIFEIENELKLTNPGVRVVPIIADIRNAARLQILHQRLQPQVVFHAAAHKHVPLMESNMCEAVLNNVLGLKVLLERAGANGVENFVFISTDKAVNPTSIMGATKKLGEILVQQAAGRGGSRFSCVRFGNVLGSRGSVIPLFRKQIARGGPVTVTHPDVERFFMSISEAVQLIIQAGTIGKVGEIFVLNMGNPIKILDLAKEVIRLSGFREDEIEIAFTGMRPGEKLKEELLVSREKDKMTQYEKIFIAPPIAYPGDDFPAKLDRLIEAARKGDEARLKTVLAGFQIGLNRNDTVLLD